MPSSSTKPTMREIAQELGVSRTTVSLVMKGEAVRYRINPETAQRILDKVKDLKYRPSYHATALSSRKTRVVGVVFPNVFESFMSEMVKGIEDVLYPADYTMMLCTSRFDRDQEMRNIEQLVHRGVDGIIMVFNAPFRGQAYDYAHIRGIARGKAPVVFVDRTLPNLRAPCVLQDDAWAARTATNALIARGCRTLGYIGLDIDVSSIRDRRAGFLAALKAHSLRLNRHHDIQLDRRDPDATDLFSRLSQIWQSESRPDGLLVSTTGIAHRAIGLLRAIGARIGTDVQVAKFGADPAHFATGAICVLQPHQEMGAAAARLLLESLDSTAKPLPRRVDIRPIIAQPHIGSTHETQ